MLQRHNTEEETRPEPISKKFLEGQRNSVLYARSSRDHCLCNVSNVHRAEINTHWEIASKLLAVCLFNEFWHREQPLFHGI